MWKHLLKKTLRKLGISIDRREKESYPQFLCLFNAVELSAFQRVASST